jgi:hypothetical protein
MADSYFCSEK